MNLEIAAKTALHRKGPSAPLLLLLEQHAVIGRVLDYGCGHGADVEYLKSLSFPAVGYDPKWAPVLPTGRFDTVLCTYVLNVLPKWKADEVAREARKWLKFNSAGSTMNRRVFFTTRTDVEDSASQRDVRSVPRTKVFARGSGFIIWCYAS